MTNVATWSKSSARNDDVTRLAVIYGLTDIRVTNDTVLIDELVHELDHSIIILQFNALNQRKQAHLLQPTLDLPLLC